MERKKRLLIDDAVKSRIAEESHRTNEKSRNARGGRIVQSNITKYVDSVVVELMEKNLKSYREAIGVRVFLEGEAAAAELLEGSP